MRELVNPGYRVGGGGARSHMAENHKLRKIMFVNACVPLCASDLPDMAGGVSLRNNDVNWRVCDVSGCFQEGIYVSRRSS